MWQVPKVIALVKGAAEGSSQLNAFDNALLASGIGNFNLVKVSSIVPLGAKIVQLKEVDIPAGALVPTVYAYTIGDKPGEIISAAIALGLNNHSFGIIMESADHFEGKKSEEKARRMVEEAFKTRQMKLDKIISFYSEHKVKKLGCALAAVILWGGE